MATFAWAPARRFSSRFALLSTLAAILSMDSPQAWAETRLLVQLTTGGDDLRGGNTAFISLVRTDGNATREQVLSNGEGGGARSTRQVTFPENVSVQDVRSIRIRHDGNPRSGHPFDSYDNWNLSALRVQLVDTACRSTSHQLYVSARDGFREVRFTGALRQIDLPARPVLPASWCTHSGARRLTGDVNGDGQVDAVCQDRNTGTLWVALRDGADLVETWTNTTTRWCSHAGAALFLGDFNGDRRADLICKDPRRIWFDAYSGEASYYRGTGTAPIDATWCTGPGNTFSVGDQNGDGRTDLVCRSGDGTYSVDWADSSGRFAGRTDISGRTPDFEITRIDRAEGGYRMSIRNNGAEGYARSFWCSPNPSPSATYTGSLHISAGGTRPHFIPLSETDRVTCWAGGRSVAGVPEILISNNQLTRCFR